MDFPFIISSDKVERTEELGAMLSRLLTEDEALPRFVAMYGDLGVGKTAFVRGFCSELCPNSTVKSPTFALVNEYRCIKPGEIKKVCHFDMYRVTDEDDLYSIGYDDYLRDDNLCIAEWCELIPYALPEERIEVKIEKTDLADDRRITINLVI